MPFESGRQSLASRAAVWLLHIDLQTRVQRHEVLQFFPPPPELSVPLLHLQHAALGRRDAALSDQFFSAWLWLGSAQFLAAQYYRHF